MNQVIKTENPDTTGTNAILIVLLLAAVVAFGVWFFGQGAIPRTDETPIDVDVNLPGTQQQQNTTPTTPGTAEQYQP